jgi:type IV secretion system protein VirD4
VKFKGIRLGHSCESGEVSRYDGPGHLITVAPTRTGKGRDIIIPALLDWPYSAAVVDPKGELAAVTSEQRGRIGEVRYVDPYGLLTESGHAVGPVFTLFPDGASAS